MSTKQEPSSTPAGAQAFHPTDTPVHDHPTLKQCVMDTAASTLQSFAPVKNICTYLCALHAYGHDISRQVRLHLLLPPLYLRIFLKG
jgi:hypothetical protein